MAPHGIRWPLPRLLCMILLWSLIAFTPPVSYGQDIDKLDPTLKKLMADPSLVQTPAFRPLTKVTQGQALVDVFINTTNGSTNFGMPDVQVKTSIGAIVVAGVPVDRLLELATRSSVRSIQAARVWKPQVDQSVPATNATIARDAYNVTGKGVIIGVIDTGIDPGHLDFRSPVDDTRTRILYFWDMSRSDGVPPKGFDGAGGMEIDSSAINADLRLGITNTINNDFVGHGTHVAGIAAGNGAGTQYIGMAPDADLIVVKATRAVSGGSFSSADIITALSYIDAKARVLGKPYVVNMSLGGFAGPADGTDAEGIAIDHLTGSGKTGKVVVIAAGNDGERRVHARATLSANRRENVSRQFTLPLANLLYGLQIWAKVKPNDINKVYISVTGPDTTFGPVSGFPLVARDQRDGIIQVVSSPHPYILTGTDIQTDVTISPKIPGTWTISIRGEKGSGEGTVDIWLLDPNGTGAEFKAEDGDNLFLVSQPGTTKNAITVGSYVTKSDWVDGGGFFRTRGVAIGAASSFTSPGPARDGRQKPEIAAPGEAIASARSALSEPGAENILPDPRFTMLWGTSMATPHVTGAIALALEEAQKRGVALDAIQIRNALMTSSITDTDTGPTPNNTWGTGKMDVDGFFTALFGQPLAVTIASFSASVDGPMVHLVWEVANAADHTGFHVYRSATGRTADRVRLTPQPITGGTNLTFVDRPQDPGTYYYWLEDAHISGNTSFLGPIVVTMPVAPAAFRLGQNTPNPFNPTTSIEYDLPQPGHVVIRIYDALGREVRTLIDARQAAGFHRAVWDGRDHRGMAVSSGVYFYTLTAVDFVQTRKMILVK